MTQITIAAAHKLAERLERDIDVKQADLAQLARPLSARVASDASRALTQRTEFNHELAKLEAMNAVSIVLALQISEANDKVGINSLLKERKLVTKRQSWLNSLLRNQKTYGTNAIEHQQAPEYFDRLKGANSTEAVNINILADHMLPALSGKLKVMSTHLDQLNDEISRLNHSNSITLDLSAEQLVILGK
jgi:hypothetical protein